MSEPQLIDSFPSDRRQLVDLELEGMPSPAYLLRPEGATRTDAIVAELISVVGAPARTVYRIQIRDRAFRTAKGIRIGSTVGDLRAAYHLDSIVSGEGQVAIVVEAMSASFFLDQSGPNGRELWKLRGPALVPDAVKIERILLVRLPAASR
jgi:hypothetical protein